MGKRQQNPRPGYFVSTVRDRQSEHGLPDHGSGEGLPGKEDDAHLSWGSAGIG